MEEQIRLQMGSQVIKSYTPLPTYDWRCKSKISLLPYPEKRRSGDAHRWTGSWGCLWWNPVL